MYRVFEVEDYLRIHPSLLDQDINEAIRKTVLQLHKNKYLDKIGYILDIIDIQPEKENRIYIGDPYVYYKTRYKIISFTIEENEVYRGKVTTILDYGAMVLIGPIEGLLHISQISKKGQFKYDKASKKIVGPDNKTIEVGDEVYVRVSTKSVKQGFSDARISLSMREEGLGCIRWFEKK